MNKNANWQFDSLEIPGLPKNGSKTNHGWPKVASIDNKIKLHQLRQKFNPAEKPPKETKKAKPDFNYRLYFLGFLLMPWIWIWGYFLIISVLMILFQQNQTQILARQPALNSVYYPDFGLSIWVYWWALSFFIWANYTLAFVYRFSISRLKSILFITSVVILFLYAIYFWPLIGLVVFA